MNEWEFFKSELNKYSNQINNNKNMQLSKSEDLKFAQPKVGLTQAVVNRITDLGTQEDSYEGNVTNRHKLLIEFALPKQTTADEGEEPRMLKITRFFTASLHPKGALKPFIEGMTGKAVDEESFNTADLIGLNCMVNIMEYTKLNNDKGTKIASVSPLMEGVDPVPAPDGIDFSLDTFDVEQFNNLSEGIRNMISKSPEFNKIKTNSEVDLPF